MGDDNGRSPTFGALFKELANSSTELLRAEMRLVRIEASSIATHVARGSAQVALGGVLLLLGALAFATGVVLLVGDQWLPDDRYWLGAFFVLLVSGALTAWLARKGTSRLSPSQLAPAETLDSLREDREWVKRQLKSDATSK